MTDVPVAVTVLNGEIVVGDKVAVAASTRGDSMRLGTVIGFKPIRRYGHDTFRVGVRVEKSNGTGYAYKVEEVDGERKAVRHARPYTKWYDDPMNIVKVA